MKTATPKRQSNRALARAIDEALHLGEGHIRISKGKFRIYRGFFWSPKQSEYDWAQALDLKIKAAGFMNLLLEDIDGNHYMPFRGGDPVHRNSHYCAIFKRID
jgi:hypothetical protein